MLYGYGTLRGSGDCTACANAAAGTDGAAAPLACACQEAYTRYVGGRVKVRTLLPALDDEAPLLAAAWGLLGAAFGGAVAAMLSLSRSMSSDALPVALRLRSLHCTCSSRYDKPSTSCNVSRAIVPDDQTGFVCTQVSTAALSRSCDDQDWFGARRPRRARAPWQSPPITVRNTGTDAMGMIDGF